MPLVSTHQTHKPEAAAFEMELTVKQRLKHLKKTNEPIPWCAEFVCLDLFII